MSTSLNGFNFAAGSWGEIVTLARNLGVDAPTVYASGGHVGIVIPEDEAYRIGHAILEAALCTRRLRHQNPYFLLDVIAAFLCTPKEGATLY